MAVSRGHIETLSAPGARAPRPDFSRRSSVVERVIGNDEVLSSILSGGTRKNNTLGDILDNEYSSKVTA
jgi:hypothetical protein